MSVSMLPIFIWTPVTLDWSPPYSWLMISIMTSTWLLISIMTHFQIRYLEVVGVKIHPVNLRGGGHNLTNNTGNRMQSDVYHSRSAPETPILSYALFPIFLLDIKPYRCGWCTEKNPKVHSILMLIGLFAREKHLLCWDTEISASICYSS